jgi:hypothetical protein
MLQRYTRNDFDVFVVRKTTPEHRLVGFREPVTTPTTMLGLRDIPHLTVDIYIVIAKKFADSLRLERTSQSYPIWIVTDLDGLKEL